MTHETAIAPNVPKSNNWREVGVPIAGASTLVGATRGTGVKSVSALASGGADPTTNEGVIGRSVAEENTPVGSGQREATGDGGVSEGSLFESFCSTPLGSTDVAGVVGEISAWASAAERASVVSLSGAISGTARRAGFDAAKYQHWRFVLRSMR